MQIFGNIKNVFRLFWLWHFICLLTVNDYRAVVFIFLGISVAVGLWRVAAALSSEKRQKNVRKTSEKRQKNVRKNQTNATDEKQYSNQSIDFDKHHTCLDIDKKRCVVHNLCSRLPGFLQNINFNDNIKGRQQIFYKTTAKRKWSISISALPHYSLLRNYHCDWWK